MALVPLGFNQSSIGVQLFRGTVLTASLMTAVGAWVLHQEPVG
jgi:hypothetical protein